MSIKKKAMCIDLDTEESIFHLKVTPDTLKCCADCHLCTPTWFLLVQRPQQLSPSLSLTSCHPGEISWTVWGMGVKAATSPRVSTERDFHVSPREASLPSPLLTFPVSQWLPEKSRLFQCSYERFLLPSVIHLTLCIKNRGLLLPSRHQSTRQK